MIRMKSVTSQAPDLPGQMERIERGRRFWRRFWPVAVITALLMVAGFGCKQLLETNGVFFGYNETGSLTGSWYVVIEGSQPLQRGELIGYRGTANKRYPVGIMWVKRVGGVAGDRVTATERWFHVNGLALHAKEQTRFGEPLDLGPVGTIPPQHYFVYTTHRDSYDSRYADIGWIKPEQVVGRAYEIF